MLAWLVLGMASLVLASVGNGWDAHLRHRSFFHEKRALLDSIEGQKPVVVCTAVSVFIAVQTATTTVYVAAPAQITSVPLQPLSASFTLIPATCPVRPSQGLNGTHPYTSSTLATKATKPHTYATTTNVNGPEHTCVPGTTTGEDCTVTVCTTTSTSIEQPWVPAASTSTSSTTSQVYVPPVYASSSSTSSSSASSSSSTSPPPPVVGSSTTKTSTAALPTGSQPPGGAPGTPQTPSSMCSSTCPDSVAWLQPVGGAKYPLCPEACSVRGTECSANNPCVSSPQGGGSGLSYHDGYTGDAMGTSVYCGLPYAHGDHIVALGWPHMRQDGVSGNCNTGDGQIINRIRDANCGRKISISLNGGTPLEAYVIDRCQACGDGLDVPPWTFSALGASVAQGRVGQLSWHFVD